jgi:dTDP-4-amino-4,6-dideoxygalactose transaminase
MRIEFHKHNISQQDIDNATQVLHSIFLTTGEQVGEFEKNFSQYLGCRYTVGVTSCTAALHLSLLASGIGPGDEVVTTPLTFIATANSVMYVGARPVFVDVEPETGNINADLIEAAVTSKTKAILPVHLYGQICDMRKIRKIADTHSLAVIEDAAHAIEAVRDGSRPCELGDAACFSFYATKNITSGEGGAVSTNNKEIAEKIEKLRLHGMSKGAAERYSNRYEHWDMEILGWKYNMDNIQAALLLGQLNRIEQNWERRELICRMYEDAFKNNPNISLLKIVPGSKSARHIFTILVPPERRDDILWKLQEKGVGVAVNFRVIHLLSYYRRTFGYEKGVFPVAETIGDSTITIPMYPKLTDEEVQYIIQMVKEVTAY